MAEYNGSIELIAGLKPKNNGDFALVYAPDVLLTDGRRLSEIDLGGGGASSWNDLADKPFGEDAEGNITKLDNKYLDILEKRELKKTVLGETTYTFTFLSDLGAFGKNVMPAPCTLTLGETYTVTWDGEKYVCETQDASALFGDSAVGLGNLSSVGLSGNGEPFGIGWSAMGMLVCSAVDTTPQSHTFSIDIPMGEGYYIKPEFTQPSAASVDMSRFESDGIIAETYADGSVKTTTIEYDSTGNPVKITDGDGNVTEFTW